jgi:hypothetical protein
MRNQLILAAASLAIAALASPAQAEVIAARTAVS